ncbi:SpoIID/LytB domain protein [Kineosphaera limosa]|uniref:SpoIID/LytB domain-containing protein n=1 Tax=Kineosphaera limosa TaxID=111564 RepID=UPI0002F0BB1D|nr:SpoIID/LytB domain-containing protein [Kineosphaera limosa]NYE02563.1 SpoIID/LytB domain protein [Kineosphaera limosa]
MHRSAGRPGYRTGRRLAAAAAATAIAATGTIGGIALAPSAQAAEEVVQRPESGSFTLAGRGFGHGRGMSQWGAYGAADAGLAWAQILDFYYPGTTRTSVGNSTIRVHITADKDGDTTVLPAPGLSVTHGRTVTALPTGPNYTAWRAVRYPNGITLQYRDAAGTWKAQRSFRGAAGGVLVFRTNSGVVRLALPNGTSQDLRGNVFATMSGTSMITVLNTPMETYLRGVVPSEMPTSWHIEALGAQSVAARTYAAAYRDRQRARGALWDICDTISCQVFKGTATYNRAGVRTTQEYERTDRAIAATSGTVMRAGKAANSPFAFAEYSASNGGFTVAAGPYYQVAKADPYDGRMRNPNTAWNAVAPVARLEKEFGLGRLVDVRVLKRDGRGALGGRVQEMQLTGTSRTVTVSGTKMRQVLKLRSDWFVVTPTPPVSTTARR